MIILVFGGLALMMLCLKSIVTPMKHLYLQLQFIFNKGDFQMRKNKKAKLTIKLNKDMLFFNWSNLFQINLQKYLHFTLT